MKLSPARQLDFFSGTAGSNHVKLVHIMSLKVSPMLFKILWSATALVLAACLHGKLSVNNS